MKLKSLELKRTESWQTPANALQCVVTLSGDTGTQSLVLSHSAIIDILRIVAKETHAVAQRNASMTAGAMQDAQSEILLTSDASPMAIEG